MNNEINNQVDKITKNLFYKKNQDINNIGKSTLYCDQLMSICSLNNSFMCKNYLNMCKYGHVSKLNYQKPIENNALKEVSLSNPIYVKIPEYVKYLNNSTNILLNN
jgi:hypothetical protein